MDKLDKFLENELSLSNGFLSEEYSHNNSPSQKVILIFGDNKLTRRVKAYCNSQEYIFEEITEINQINSDYKYACLLALSNNDVDNLTISSIILKVYCISCIIALCNNQSNLKIYNEFNFEKVLFNGEIDGLYDIAKEFIQNAIKNKV